MLLEGSHEGVLVGWGLETTVSELGAGIDELQLDVFQSQSLGVDQQGLPESQDPLLGSNATSLDHDEVLFDLSVVGDATHGVDGLISQVVIGGSAVLDQTVGLFLSKIQNGLNIGYILTTYL